MAFFDRFKKTYMVKARCYNCGFNQDCKVPKGNTIDSWLQTEAAVCENCGNATLRRIEFIKVPAEVRKPIKQYAQVPPPHMNMSPKPLKQFQHIPIQKSQKPIQKSQRPVQQRLPQQQKVQYPVNEPVYQESQQQPQEPAFGVGPKKINFWTGKDENDNGGI
jgi:hypothetical protein